MVAVAGMHTSEFTPNIGTMAPKRILDIMSAHCVINPEMSHCDIFGVGGLKKKRLVREEK